MKGRKWRDLRYPPCSTVACDVTNRMRVSLMNFADKIKVDNQCLKNKGYPQRGTYNPFEASLPIEKEIAETQ